VGASLLGVNVHPKVVDEAMAAVGAAAWGDFSALRRTVAPLLWAYVLGSTLGSILLAGVAYRASLSMILAHRRRQAQQPRETAKL
jgi:hypothetical protein